MAQRYRPRRRRGFTLVEILIVVVILGLIMAMAAVLLRSISATQKRSVTATRLANVEAALVQFAMQQQRLPCPADGTQPVASATAGKEAWAVGPPATCTGNQQNGVVPWVTLGLSAADASDGWDRRITYRVGASLVVANAMNMYWCDPAGTGAAVGGACNSTCTSATLTNCTPPSTYLTSQGLLVKSLAAVTVMNPTPGAGIAPTGAAYVLISHGESGGGAFLDTGVMSTSTLTDGNEEQNNYASLALRAPPSYYVDDQATDVSGAAHFDDIVVRASVLNIANKAGLGPRTHP